MNKNFNLSRFEATFSKTLSKVLLDSTNKNLRNITITSSHITNDLSLARIYIMTRKGEEDIAFKSLEKAKSFINREISKHLSMRKMPKIEFYLDNSFDYGQKIDKKIEMLEKNV